VTTTRESFSLSPIVHAASGVERVDKSGDVEARRYWLTADKEVLRRKPLLRDASCYIVTAEQQGGEVHLDFEIGLTIPGSSWTAPVTGSATLHCPQTEVHRLLNRWRKEEGRSTGKPDGIFYDEFHAQLRAAAEESGESAICAASGSNDGGRLALLVSQRMRELWGVTVTLRFELRDKGRLRRQELSVEARVRVQDHAQDFPAVAVVELDDQPVSVLRAVASMDREHEMAATLASVLVRFYLAEVTMEALSDPSLRTGWTGRLEAEIVELSRRQFGRRARLVNVSETAPEPPGRPDELVRATLPGRVITNEPEPVDIELVVKLRMTSLSKLLRAMSSRPGRTFNSEFELVARAVAGPIVDRWTGQDLNSEARKRIESDLFLPLNDKAGGFGYEVEDCSITTSLDPEVADRRPSRVSLVARHFRTSEQDVTVKVEVNAELTFAPGARQRKSLQKLLEPYAEDVRDLLEACLARNKPSEIYRYWTIPFPNGIALQEQLSRDVGRLFRNVAERIDVTVTLQGQAELLKMRDHILQQKLDAKGVRLTPENVPGEIAVDVHAFVRGVTEPAWRDMAAAHELGQEWNPLTDLSADLTRLMQETFRTAMEALHGSRVSRRLVIDDLKEGLIKAVTNRYHIVLEPSVVAYSSPEVVAFFRHEAEERQQDVESFFEIVRALKAQLKQQQLARVEAIGRSEITHPETRRIEESIKVLETEIGDNNTKIQALQKDFANALYFVNLLSIPSDEDPDKLAGNGRATLQDQIGDSADKALPESDPAKSGAAAGS
jgi:hypothetical protein